ncbi:lectin subunit alpha-like [Stomoxys calcitrans]|uniref:lectin subunit alpha-like n=1 Tax=Stomoxys calcitrans TaxID=35570 RepID=UPI0027E2D3EA|nr:lectin subunit alpha-like [Stomoxys calcitrans]
MFNWYEAWEQCLHNNMTLLAMDSAHKYRQITMLLKEVLPNNLTYSYWIGAHDLARAKHFVWQSTGRAMQFTNWSSSQPSYGSDHCVRIARSKEDQWIDSVCSNNYGYICENLQCSNERSLVYENGTPSSKYNVNFWNVLGNQKS